MLFYIQGVIVLEYIVTFLEGVISFISPCMLPLIPAYLTYLSGDAERKGNTLVRSIGFVSGFTLAFTLLGTFAAAIGQIFSSHDKILNIICGIIVIIFGLSYLEIIPLPFFKGMTKKKNVTSFFSAVLFGAVFSVSLTPCVGAFLGSALMMASSSANALKGTFLLLIYSLGLGIPFILSAIFIDRLNTTFNLIKKHYLVINRVCGIFLIIVGMVMATGLFSRLVSILA